MTKPGFMQTIKEEGMPKTGDNSERGDLHVDFVVEFPQELTANQKAAFKEFSN